MKAIVLTSTSFRHCYYVAQIARKFDVVSVLCEEKRNYYTQQREESEKVRAHFARLVESEQQWFSLPNEMHQPAAVHVPDINSEDTLELALSLGADCVFLFGTSILKSHWLDAFSNKIINLHLGLSPYYRGSASLFWPFFFRELEFLGTTIHLATEKVDGGSMLHRIQPKLLSGEDYYTITNRLIRDSIDLLPEVAENYLNGQIVAMPQEIVSGRFLKKEDFSEEALAQVLDYIGSGLCQEKIYRVDELKCHF